jgi:fibro-slime domain-containing protein
MQNSLDRQAARLTDRHRKRKKRGATISLLSLIVAICTFSALMLPAITLERSTAAEMALPVLYDPGQEEDLLPATSEGTEREEAEASEASAESARPEDAAEAEPSNDAETHDDEPEAESSEDAEIPDGEPEAKPSEDAETTDGEPEAEPPEDAESPDEQTGEAGELPDDADGEPDEAGELPDDADAETGEEAENEAAEETPDTAAEEAGEVSGEEADGDAGDTSDEEETFLLDAVLDENSLITVSGSLDSLPCPADAPALSVREITDSALLTQAESLCLTDAAEALTGDAGQAPALIVNTLRLFDICLISDGEEIEPVGPVTLVFSGLPEQEADTEESRCFVYRIDEEENRADDMEAVSGENGELIMETDHFSTYAVLRAEAPQQRAAGSFAPTVDSRSDGIILNLFNYSGKNLDTWDNSVQNPIYNGINSGNKKLLFLGSGNNASNVSPRNGINCFTNGPTALQGIVSSTLGADGYPTLRSGGQSLDYLFEPTAGTYKVVYPDVNYLFQRDAEGYYWYSSNENYAKFDPGDNTFSVYSGTYRNSDGGAIGFFPFNEYNTRYTQVKPDSNYYDHHFGLTMEAEFCIPPDGKVNGNDMILEFSGDDDMWVFIDDVLVLDIGGIHEALGGKINFTTGAVTVDSAQAAYNAGSTIGTSATLTNIFRAAGKTYDSSANSLHRISLFYLERGGCYSDLTLRFNLCQPNEDPVLTAEKRWETLGGSPVDPPTDSVSMELRRRWLQPAAPASHTVNFYVWQMEWDNAQGKNVRKKSLKATEEVGHGGSVSFYAELWSGVNVTAESTAGGTITRTASGNGYDFVLRGVERDGDVTVSFNQDPWNPTFRVTGRDAPTGGSGEAAEMDELAEAFSLSEENGWSKSWSRRELPANFAPGVPYEYYLVETDIPEGYEPVYDNNDGISEGVITVTNISLYTVELPETGGFGTLPYTLSGLALLSAALMYALFFVFGRKRRRER